ncbi:MAG: sugar-binding protein [candidate division FCPU426 bacterium]
MKGIRKLIVVCLVILPMASHGQDSAAPTPEPTGETKAGMTLAIKPGENSFFTNMMLNMAEKKMPALTQYLRGMLMSKKEGLELREKLKKEPEDLKLRLKFAGYRKMQTRYGTQADLESDENLLWIIQFHPEAQLTSLWGEMHPSSAEAADQAEKLWAGHFKDQPKAEILCSGSGYYMLNDPAKSQELLKKAEQLDPKNDNVKTARAIFNAQIKNKHMFDENGNLIPYAWQGKPAQILEADLGPSTLSKAPVIHLGPETASKVVLGKVKDAAALSGDLVLVMDKKSLHVHAEVHQDHPPVNKQESNQLWDGDAVEVWISGKPEKGSTHRFQPAAEDYYFVLAPTSKSGKPAFHCERAGEAGVVLTSASTPWGYTLDASIPLDNFKNHSWTPGKRYRFDCALNKAGKKGVRDTKLFWNSESDEAWSSPDLWGQMEISH